MAQLDRCVRKCDDVSETMESSSAHCYKVPKRFTADELEVTPPWKMFFAYK